jgi:alanine dehydrogenase
VGRREISVRADLAAQPGEKELLAGVHDIHPHEDALLPGGVVGHGRHQIRWWKQLTSHYSFFPES